MNVNSVEQDGVCRIAVVGEFTIQTIRPCYDNMLSIIEKTGLPVDIDLSEVIEADSAGLQLLSYFASAYQHSQPVTISALSECILQKIERFNFNVHSVMGMKP